MGGVNLKIIEDGFVYEVDEIEEIDFENGYRLRAIMLGDDCWDIYQDEKRVLEIDVNDLDQSDLDYARVMVSEIVCNPLCLDWMIDQFLTKMFNCLGINLVAKDRNLLVINDEELSESTNIPLHLESLPSWLEEVAKSVSNRPEEKANVYVIEFQDGVVKLGISKTPNKRIKTIEKQSGRNVQRTYLTPKLAREKAQSLEQILKGKFASKNLNGEFYSERFKTVVDELKRLIGSEKE